MYYAKFIVCLSFKLVIALLTSCGGRQTASTSEASINSAIAELDVMESPQGADPAVFASLKDALRTALLTRGDGKLVSTPPTGIENAIPDLVITDNGDGTFNYTWHYYNIGDYNQDGVVGVSDITPLAMHYNQTWNKTIPGEVNTLQAVADGSSNEKIDIADVTPIAMNFGVQVAGYYLWASTTENGTYMEVQYIPLSEGLDEDIARMRFSVNIPATGGLWYVLVPKDAEGNYGDASGATQAPIAATVWGHSWGGALDDNAHAADADAGGNTYIAGAYNLGANDADAVLLKFSPDGTILWKKTWGGAADDIAYGVAVDDVGNAYVTGETESFGVTTQAFILKYDSSGTLLWQKTWGGIEFTSGRAIALTGAGEVCVTGYTMGTGSGYESLLLLKYDVDGNFVYMRALSAANDMDGYAVTVDTAGNIYLTGATQDTPTGYSDVLVAKYAEDGMFQWQKSWGSDNTDTAYAIKTDADGNIYVAGETWNIGQGGFDVVLLKIAPLGSLIWQETWGGDSHDQAYAMDIDSGGNLYLAGTTISFGAGPYEGLALKFTSGGSLTWAKTWGNAVQDDTFRAIARRPDGTLTIAGWDQQANGAWGDPAAIPVAQSVPWLDATGVESVPVGADGVVAGTEASPTGVLDTGGGANDIIVIQVDQSAW